MLKIDDNLLNDVGLSSMPADDKKAFLAHIRQTLEMRVGTRLASHMSNEQLDEFERFIKGDEPFAREFLDQNKPGWAEDPKFSEQLAKAKERNIPEMAIITEYAALRWLEVNYPGYKQVVEEELTKLKHEIKQQAPQILEANAQAAAQTPAVAADPGAQVVDPAAQQQPPQPPVADSTANSPQPDNPTQNPS